MILFGCFAHDNNYNIDTIKKLFLSSAPLEKNSRQYDYIFSPNSFVMLGLLNTDHRSERIIRLPNRRGVLLGRAFLNVSKAMTRKYAHENDFLNFPIEDIFNHIWGRYLIVYYQEDGSLKIARDPTGLLPLYYYNDSHVSLFSSDVRFIYDVLEKKPAINLLYLMKFIIGGHHFSTLSPFEGIHELPPGKMLLLAAIKPKMDSLWGILHEVGKHTIYDPQSYKERLLDCAHYCVSAWIEGAEALGVEFSGGIDSSALVLLLKSHLPPDFPFFAINYFHPDVPSSNETSHTRNFVKEHKIRLIEYDWRNALPFSKPLQEIKRFNRPFPSLIDHKLDEALLKQFWDYKNIEYLNGYGGDNIFLAAPPISIIADLISNGNLMLAYQKTKDLSKLYNLPILNFLKESFYVLRKKSQLSINNHRMPSWLSHDLMLSSKMNLDSDYIEETFSHLTDAQQVRMKHLYTAFSYADQGLRDPDVLLIHPFLSQPLVELALSIPIENTFNDQYSRVHFRDAFNHAFKSKTFFRRSKGEVTGVLLAGMIQNRKRVQELCFEGLFARKGVINLERLHRTFNEIQAGKIEDLDPFLNLAAIEIWAEPWHL